MVIEQTHELTQQVIGRAMKVHRALGPGFVGFVYLNALVHQLRGAGLAVETEKPLKAE